MKRLLLFFKTIWNAIKRLFHRQSRFEKLLSTYKETIMDISTLTQLINAFRAETALNAITPDSLGQLLQKIVNLLGDAADASTTQTLTEWMNDLTSAQALVKNIRATADNEGITFYMDKVDATTGDAFTQSLRISYPNYTLAKGAANGYVQLSLTDNTGNVVFSSVKIYGATHSAAGIMTAEDKTKLDNTASGLNSLADEVALKATKNEVEQIQDWKDTVSGIGDVVKSVAVNTDNTQMYVRLNKASLENGRTSLDNILVPHVSPNNAGVMSAEDYNNLQALVEAAEEEGDDSSEPVKVYRIAVEPKGDKLILMYNVELTAKGYVPYLFRYNVRRTHFGKVQSGGVEREHGERRKGWHRNYDQNRIRLQNNEILVGRLTNPYENVPHWDFLANGPRELFGNIHDLSNEYGRWIGYRFYFGKKQYKFSEDSPYHRFKFGIAFGPPITETRKNAYPNHMVTNIAPFHVLVRFDPSESSGPQDAPQLLFRYCL